MYLRSKIMSNSQERPLDRFVSKADTLQVLSGLLTKSLVEDLHVFLESDWELNRPEIVNAIKDKFQGKTIIVRSSALSEDTVSSSNAGAFSSILNVDSTDERSIDSAIGNVVESYREKGAGNPNNRILVQRQTVDAVSSGIVLTRDYNGSPYYVVNYSEGVDTTLVTSGRRSKSVKILKSGKADIPPNLRTLVDAVQEIEGFTPLNRPLDIEYAIKSNGQVVTFQARPLVAVKEGDLADDTTIFDRVDNLKNRFRELSQRKSHLAGDTTYFGDMPDWNPAEIIGSSPHLLAFSLYDEIITDSIWHRARTSQGYTDVNPAQLVVLFGNKPYVDIRNTFNSFIPANLSQTLRERLVGFYLEKLRRNPQLQDKVEFEVLYTCYDLSFSRRSRELSEAGFAPEELSQVRTALLDLTNNLLNTDSIQSDLNQNEALERYRQSLPVLTEVAPQEKLDRALQLLEACKENGTLQFSRLARLAFIGRALLRSLVEEGVIDSGDYHRFLESVNTVASNFAHDMDQLNQGKMDKSDFLSKYGHLRPGTYDIRIPRYDNSEDYFATVSIAEQSDTPEKKRFELSDTEHVRISELLNEHGLVVNANELFGFVRSALEAREYSKFLFTRCLSDAIELIALAGEYLGFSREDLSHLNIEALKAARGKDDEDIRSIWSEEITRNRTEFGLNGYISLPPVIFSEADLEVVTYYDSQPNYITNKKVQGDIVLLKGDAQVDVTGKIVVLEAADPGYDWIFAKKPAALITKYGGPASHMAVRCAELGLPAIIGSGDLLYESFMLANSIILDCENHKIELKGAID